MSDWVRTQGDRVHSLEARFTDSNGGLDITPNSVVTFSGKLVGALLPSIGGAGVAVRPGAQPDDPNRGLVRYDLSTADVVSPGLYYCQWQLVQPGSTQVQSFPEDGIMTLIILPAF